MMGLGWIKDYDGYSIKNLLLLEEVQIEWIDQEYNKQYWAKVLQSHADIKWYFEHKAPSKAKWVESLLAYDTTDVDLRCAEKAVLQGIEDWLIYVTDPSIYDNLQFLTWDERELTDLCDFSHKRIIDIGSGTGKQAFAVLDDTNTVYCVEPVARLRKYLLHKADKRQRRNIFVSDGLLTRLPFEDSFADITMGGHVFGDDLDAEYNEMCRVTKEGGMIILMPGNNDVDNDRHRYLISRGFCFARFCEPTDGIKRKYWKQK